MEIRQNLTNTNYNARGTEPTWIVIHNTANGTSAEGTAYANTQYFKNTYREASAHYFVDDGDIVWQCVRDTDTAWHVGEAPSQNGCYNYNAIGIEVCETGAGFFSEKEIETLQELVPYLMDKYGIDASHICRHHDVTGKLCPWWYSDDGRWRELKERILEGEDMNITQEQMERQAQVNWEYIYHQGMSDEDKVLGGGGTFSNRYNVLNAAYSEAHKANERLDELERKIDAIAEKLS